MTSRLFKSGTPHLSTGSHRALKTASTLNFSTELSSSAAWSPDHIATLGLPGEIAAQAFDPVQSLLCVATKAGSLHLFGAGPVKLEWAIKPSYAIKLLAFKSGTAFLFVIDIKDTLTVFDLSDVAPSTNEPQRWAVLSLRSEATCLEAPPGHSHAFIGLRDGTVNCFDILSAKLSPYLIPNLWQEQQNVMRRSGMLTGSKHHIPMVVDIKSHPRDLNYILVAYDGGVALWNFSKKAVERTYDLLLPPGAVGGSDEQDPNLFSDRRPNVTCLAWRPDALVFCVGHEDGCLSFWDVQDGDKPLQVRTMDRTDVNIANAEQLFAASESSDSANPPAFRQPIFALTWSGFSEEGFLDKWSSSVRTAAGSGPVIPKTSEDSDAESPGITALTILGGLLPNDAIGIHCLVFKPYEDKSKTMGKMTTAAAAAQVQRQSMQDSLLPHGRIQYPTWTQPEDFCLFSDNPHFGGAFDPMCILILEAPDPTLAADSSPNAPQAARSYTAYSFTRASHVTPKKMALPADLDLVGHSRMTGGDIHMCSITAFQKLVNARASTESPYLPIKGGKAYPRLHHHPNKQIDPPSLQEARILCSTHVDRSVRLWDIGSTLLTKSPRREDSQITRFYPDHLSTIELMPLLLATNILTASRVWQSTPELVYVTAVSPALEAGEIAVSLSSGECIVFRLSAESTESTSSAPASMPQSPHSFSNAPSRPSFEGAESINSSSSKGKGSFRNSVFKKTAGSLSKKTPKSEESSTFASNQDVSIHDLSGAPQAPPGVLAFRPAYCIARQRSVGSCCTSLTNMGFLGIAWEDGALTIVDLRGPDCIYHQTFKGERASRLSWTVAPLGDDLRILPRLLACFSSGSIRQLTLSFSLDTWIVTQGGSQETEIKQHDSLAHPLLISVQDPFGEVMHPTPRNLAEAQLAQDVEQPRDPELHSLLVVASQTSAATFVNIDGGRIAKVEYIEGIAAKILSFGRKSSALFVACRDGGMIAYSLPHLELLFQHKPLPSEGPFGTCSISPDGEFLDFHGPAFISILSTFAAGRGQAPPDVVAFDPSLDMPSLPTMPGNMISSWWNSQVRLTPDSLDALLAGPDRKPKQVTSNARPQRKEARPKTVSEEYEFEDARPAVNETNRMLMERGNALNHLNDTFNAISQNSKEMIAEARQMAVQQAAKDKFTKMFF